MVIIEKLINTAPKFDITIEQINENTLKAHSNKFLFDSWLITIEGKDIYLHHKNKYRQKDKCYYHVQSRVNRKNWIWILEKIQSHNKYISKGIKYKTTNMVDDILGRYNRERGHI